MPSEEQKGLSCTYLADKINEDNCTAAIRVFAGDKCYIKQCTKRHDGQDSLVKLCDNDRARSRNEEVEIFEAIELPRNVDTNITDIYYQINAEYRKRLTVFFKNYNKMKLLLETQKAELLQADKENRILIATSKDKLVEIETKSYSIDIEIENFEDLSENNSVLNELEIEKLVLEGKKTALEAQIVKLEQDLKQQTSKTQECDVNIRSMAAAAKDIFDSSTLVLNQDISAASADLPSAFSNQNDPENATKRLAAQKKERENLQDQLLQDGLFVLIRIRCDEPINDEQKRNGNQKLEFKTEQGNSYIEIGENNRLTIKGAKTMIYDDRGTDGTSKCAGDSYMTDLSGKNKEKEEAIKMLYDIFYQTELTAQTKNIEKKYFDSIEQPYLDYVKFSKQSIQEEEEFPGIPPKVKADATLNFKKWKTAVDNYTPIDYYNINIKGAATQRVSDLKKKWKDQTAALERLTKEELNSMRLTIQSGVDFITGSSIGFLERQKYSDDDFSKLLNITIIGVGGSGAGKTTAAKTLMQNIIRIYGEKYPLFVKKCTIKIAFKQIYENADKIIKVENMNTNEVKRDLKFPYLSDPTSSDGPNEPYDICGIEEEDPKCEDLTHKSTRSQIAMLKKIYDLDMKTEQHRRVRTTLNNSNGSSRSIKIIQIMFVSTEKTVQICLVDTAGYEDYRTDESKEKLSIFYKQKLRLARDLNPDFNIGGRKFNRRASTTVGQELDLAKEETELIKTKAAEFVENVLIEGDFIRRSLKYIELSLKKFNFLQNQIKMADQAEKKEMKANFEKELNQAIIYKDPTTKQNVKVQSIPWLTPYLPQNSTVIVLGAFKTNMNSTEVSSAQETIKLLRDLRA